MPKGELHNIFQGHGEPWIFVGHASQSQADREAAPWLAQAKGMANSAAGMSDSGGGSTLSWETIEPGAHPSEHKFFEVFASFDHFVQHPPTSSSLGEPGGLKGDPAAATSSIVNANIPATVGELDYDVLGLELLLHNFGGGRVAADNGGFG